MEVDPAVASSRAADPASEAPPEPGRDGSVVGKATGAVRKGGVDGGGAVAGDRGVVVGVRRE
jgi:hypothetical protein